MTAVAHLEELVRRAPRAIVIGGSAGSVELLRKLTPALAPDLGVPVLTVLHVAPSSQADWARVFHESTLPVREVEDNDIAEPACLYLAPPDYHMLVDASLNLSLSVEEPVNLARPSIDVLFESAAWAFGPRLLGIVLSGANADGAAGLAAISRAGGLAWVQSPESALANRMPRAALAAAPEAHVLTIPQMMEVLHDFHA
ncbi:MAG TPA: chemotaxis protein CheB [Polyangiaceae bacterium]